MTSDGNRPQAVNSEGPVVLSAGGTAGHMFPAFALGRALLVRNIPVMLVTDARGAKYKEQYPDIPFHIVRAETLRPGLVAKLRLIVDLLTGTGQAVMLLKKMQPRAVVGFGGYSSFPAVVAAQLLKIPNVIHEQNAVLGRANKMLAGGAKKIALSFPNIHALPAQWQGKAVVTGNPVRADVAAIGPYVPPADVFNMLVFGGSQGASVFASVLPRAIGLLPEEMRKRLAIVQQCRATDMGMVRHAYDLLGINAKLESFIPDVPAQLSACHLLVARGGASTVTEAAVAGRPAIFVPYPHHRDQQQLVNANVLVKAGAALVIDEKTMTAQSLAKELEGLMANPARLAAMADAARKTLVSDADKRLADAIIGL